MEAKHYDALIIGGGMAGLTAAAYLVRAGKKVAVFERSQRWGGRAASPSHEGYQLNLGAHALYRKCKALPILKELGVEFSGNLPSYAGNYAMYRGQLDALPAGPSSLLRSKLLSWGQKRKLVGILWGLLTGAPEQWQGASLAQWLDAKIPEEGALRDYLKAFFRLTNYANAPEQQDAMAALAQAKQALVGNVLYIDGGWQSMVDGLLANIEAGGGALFGEARLARVVGQGSQVVGVELRDGLRFEAPWVFVATSPQAAAKLVEGEARAELQRRMEACTPVMASCLDLVLESLPRPKTRFVLGLDEPLYLSVHSTYASFSERDGQVLHLMRYLPPQETLDSKAIEGQLEALLDAAQPGWRERLLFRRFLPQMTVTHAMHSVDFASRARGPASEALRGLYFLGDWVSRDAMLLDGALDSARRATTHALKQTAALPQAPRTPSLTPRRVY